MLNNVQIDALNILFADKLIIIGVNGKCDKIFC